MEVQYVTVLNLLTSNTQHSTTPVRGRRVCATSASENTCASFLLKILNQIGYGDRERDDRKVKYGDRD